MSSFLVIVPGVPVESGGKRYKITEVLDFDAVLAEEEGTGKKHRLFIKDIQPVTRPASESPDDKEPDVLDLSTIPDELWQEARHRLEIIRPLLRQGRQSAAGVAEQARAARVHTATIYRWIDAFERTGQLSALLPTRPHGGKGKSRLPPNTESIIQATIEDFYLNKQKRSVQKTCDEVMRRCRNAGVEPPHPMTVRYRIAKMSDEDKLRRREGDKKAREQFAPIKAHFPGADYPLAVVQIDHTPLDIILVDDVNRRPVGRPWLTLAVDVFSRMIVGLYVSFDSPGDLATGLCIAHSILPKDNWLARYGITTPWPCWGVMKKIHVDNAKEFRGKMLRRACEEYSIELAFRPVKTPNYGGHIERLLGTLLKEIHNLPGTTFSNPRERGTYNANANAALTLFEFEKWLATYIVEDYHQRVHSALLTSPLKKYEEGIFGTKEQPGPGLPARLVDEERLRLDFMPFEERTVQPYGIVIEEIHYYHDVLRRFINAKDPDQKHLKRKFVFKYDPRDMSVIYFFDPELQQYSAIPYRDTSRPPVSLWELREVRRQLKQEGREHVDEDVIFAAYEKMRLLEETAVRETKKARRGNQRRATNLRVVKPTIPQTEVLTEVDDNWAGELDSDITPFDELEEFA
jgi:putative transposase